MDIKFTDEKNKKVEVPEGVETKVKEMLKPEIIKRRRARQRILEKTLHISFITLSALLAVILTSFLYTKSEGDGMENIPASNTKVADSSINTTDNNLIVATPEPTPEPTPIPTPEPPKYTKPEKLSQELFDVVVKECEAANIPVNFALAIMKTETQDFDVNSSSKNTNGTTDSGIMQINSSNHKSFSERYNVPDFASNPYDPVNNITVGIRYLAEHWSTYIEAYNGDIVKTILATSGAYNRGASNQNKYKNIYDYNARVYKHYCNLEEGLDVNVNYQEEMPAFKESLQSSISLK